MVSPETWKCTLAPHEPPLMVAKVAIIHPYDDEDKSGYCLKEDLAKSGYKPDMKYKFLIIFLYFWLQNENHIQEYGHFCYCFR
jgi:hypothetical protein